MRFQHEDKVRRLKTQFLMDKRAFEETTEDLIRTEAQRASKVIHRNWVVTLDTETKGTI